MPADFSILENSINYHFKNKYLLIEALSHPSFKNSKTSISNNKSIDYERFEMLGDSILNFIISEILFIKFPQYNEGELVKIKSYLVSSQVLLEIASKINLGKYLLLSRSEESSGGRNRASNIENSMEALITSIYLDSNIEIVKDFIKNLWNPFIENMDLTNIDPKSTLQEWSQKQGYGQPIYEVTNKSGTSHAPIFTVQAKINNHSAKASANSIKLAQKEVAAKLLALLKK